MENKNLTFNNKTYKSENAMKSAKTRFRKQEIKRLDRLIENKHKKTANETNENKVKWVNKKK